MPQKLNKVKLMVSIVRPEDAERLAEALNGLTRCMHFAFIGRGTARPNVRDYLGLAETEKNVVVSIIPESYEKRMLAAATETLKLYLVGKGIAFTLPLTSVSSLIAGAIAVDDDKKEGENKMNNGLYDLVVAVYNREYNDKVLEAARSAGAVGGTLVSARTLPSAGVEQFVGISLSEETEILLILTRRESRNEIMKAIRGSAGLKTDGRATVLSMPVDSLVGIGVTADEYREKNGED